MNPAARPIPAKADVPAGLIPAPMAAAVPELVAPLVHLLPDQAALEVLLPAEAAAEAQGAAVAHFALTDNAFQAPMLIFQNV